jgi:hypothetical protein
MVDENRFRYTPDGDESLSMAVVSAVAQAHHEDIIEQDWLIANDINPDALDKLFQEGNMNMTLRFEADSTTVTIDADERGNPVIEIESHR